VPGSPGARGGLEYVGNDTAVYRNAFEIKSKDTPKAWADLINLARVLNQTRPARLEAALTPILDIDGALRFLALDNALVNKDGYWARSSDYSLYQDPKGVFHLIPQDVNETFGGGGGFGGRGGPRGDSMDGIGRGLDIGGRGGMILIGRGVTLDPLVGITDASKPLRARLLAVPALKARYLAYVKDIAARWLDWKTLGPLVEQYQKLIDAEVKADTRKLDSYEAFNQGLVDLKDFADKRRAFLLGWQEKR
jgi:hypothetical protein